MSMITSSYCVGSPARRSWVYVLIDATGEANAPPMSMSISLVRAPPNNFARPSAFWSVRLRRSSLSSWPL